jgi:hypothetical protein
LIYSWKCFLRNIFLQILKTGFFHADPHPGNLAVDSDGSLIYYDYGMMGEIKSFTREKLLEMFYAVYEKDAKKVSMVECLTKRKSNVSFLSHGVLHFSCWSSLLFFRQQGICHSFYFFLLKFAGPPSSHWPWGSQTNWRHGISKWWTSVCSILQNRHSRLSSFVFSQKSDPFSWCIQVRRSIQFFLNNLMNQRPDEAATISAIGEVNAFKEPHSKTPWRLLRKLWRFANRLPCSHNVFLVGSFCNSDRSTISISINFHFCFACLFYIRR